MTKSTMNQKFLKVFTSIVILLFVFGQISFFVPNDLSASEDQGLITTSTEEQESITFETVDIQSVQEKTFEGINSNSFFIKNINEEIIQSTNFSVFGDQNQINNLKIHLAEGVKGDEYVENNFSQLYTFDFEIKKIVFNSSKENILELLSIQTLSNLGNGLPSNLIETYSVPAMNTRKRFYSNLSLDVKMREEWGAPSSSTWGPEIVNVNKFVVHHTVTAPNYNDVDQNIRDIYNFHYYRCADNSGTYDPNRENCNETHELWQDIGYNYLIGHNGQIYEGRAGGNGTIGAHSPPNSGAVGIAIIGEFTNSTPTDSQQQSLIKLMSVLSSINDIDLAWGSTVFGHRDRNSTACPGQQLYNLLPSLVNFANGIKSSNTTAEGVRALANQLVDGREEDIVKAGDDYELLVDLEGVSESEVQQLVDRVQTTTDKKEVDGKLLFKVDNDYSKKLIREVKATIPNAVVQPNFIYRPEAWDNSDANRAIPSDYDATTHWYLENINLPEAWKDLGGCASDSLCGGDPSVKIAVIDTGVAYEDWTYDAGGTYTTKKFAGLHQEIPTVDTANGTLNEGLDRNFDQLPELAGVNFVNPKDVYQEYMCTLRSFDADENNWCNTTELEKINHANDYAGHGTYVTAIIAGKTGDSAPNKVVGIAHNVSIMPINAFTPNDSSMCQDSNGNLNTSCSNQGSGFVDYRVVSTTLWVANAINHAMLYDADVINLSLGGTGYDPVMDNAIQEAYENDIVVVASAGNNGGDVANSYPAAIDNVLTVGAVDSNNTRDYYSNYGEELDIVAPVGDSSPRLVSQTYACYTASDIPCSDETNPNLFTTFTSNTNPISKSGTSFSAPQVSAAAALLKSQNQSYSAQTIKNTILSNAKDIGAIGKDNLYGYGLLDIEKSLNNQWSEPSRYSVYRFFENNVGSHFYTVSLRERNSVQNLANYNYEGSAFKVYTKSDIGTTPVYRFFNNANGTHFYTSSNAEKIKIQRDLKNYSYEGISYFVFSNGENGTTPVYRFFNTDKGFHFYTISEREKNSIINNLSYLRYEGISYYVYP